MKLVMTSDTHNLHRKMKHLIPEGDVFIAAGDITNDGSKEDVKNYNDWLRNKVPCEFKVIIAGNHDWCFANSKSEKAVKWLTEGDENIIYLQDSEVIINGIKFYGSPWQPKFYNWAFNLDRGKKLQEVWAKIPNNTDVLITHGPPAGILDPDYHGNPVGCVDLLDKVIDVKPKIHVFGHLHSGYGIKKIDNTTYINASICDESYLPKRKPIVLDI